MDEETTQEKPEESIEDNAKGVQSKTVETLDRADQIVERRERVATREEALQDRKEQFAARQAVGGELEAGQEAIKKEQTPAEYAAKAMAGDL